MVTWQLWVLHMNMPAFVTNYTRANQGNSLPPSLPFLLGALSQSGLWIPFTLHAREPSIPRYLSSVPLTSGHLTCLFESYMPFISIRVFLFPCPVCPCLTPFLYFWNNFLCVCGRRAGGRGEIFYFMSWGGGNGEMSFWSPYFSKLIIPYLSLFTKKSLDGLHCPLTKIY